MKLYKLLGENGEACNGGSGIWSLPHDDDPGEWMPAIPNPELCCRGYHGVPAAHLLDWSGDSLYEMETKGPVDVSPEKTAAARARLIRHIPEWNDKNLRLFAADCAEHVLHIYLKTNPADGGTAAMWAIDCARRYARGETDEAEQDAAWAAAWAAARAAAWAAAGAAAWDAAWAAARAAAGAAAGAAARAAARAAAGDAARAAAGAAAGDAERDWQTNRLCEYLNIKGDE